MNHQEKTETGEGLRVAKEALHPKSLHEEEGIQV